MALNLTEGDVSEYHRICSRHFQNGDTTQIPSLNLGERFISPKKSSSQRCKTAHKRKNLSFQYEPIVKHPNTISTAAATYNRDTTTSDITICSTPIGEALVTDYCVLELPTEIISSSDHNIGMDSACSSTTVSASAEETQGLVRAALTARIAYTTVVHVKSIISIN